MGQEDELAEREELGLPNRGESDLRGSDRFPGLMPANEMAETALDDMDELKPPPDPAR